MIYSKRTKNGIKRTLKKGALVILLLSAIPAYNFETTIDYFKCVFLDECSYKEES